MASTLTGIRRAEALADVDDRERRIRRAAGFLLNYAGIQVVLGVAWDSTWHYSVGRDAFLLVPSHMLLYTATALAGLVCLTVILWDTLRARAGGLEVNDANSVSILGLRMPIGLALCGAGVLTILIAAPLDDYWHTLYGAFLHVSSPFHMMDVLGGTIFFLGNSYLWAALAADAGRRGDERTRRRAEWSTMVAAALVLRLTMALSNPGLSVFQTVQLGSARFMLYPVLLAFLNVWMLVAVAEAFPRRPAATTVAAMLLVFELAVQLFVPWAVRTQAAFEGREFLDPALIPYFSLNRLAPQFVILLAGVALDAFRRGTRSAARSPALLGVMGAVPLWAAGSSFPLNGHVRAVLEHLPPGIDVRPLAGLPDAILALPLALAAGALSAGLGRGLGEIFRLSRR